MQYAHVVPVHARMSPQQEYVREVNLLFCPTFNAHPFDTKAFNPENELQNPIAHKEV
jgi:hypothetical protein